MMSCDKAIVHGEWGTWSKWSPCSATCQSGVTLRTRQVTRMAGEGGVPAWGNSQESTICNTDVPCQESKDCDFSEWSEWSGCTDKCDGVKRSNRRISEYGAGEGNYCSGSLTKYSPCNPGVGEPAPSGPQNATDCKMGSWATWSTCTSGGAVTCGTGQHERSRIPLVQAQAGGKACDDSVRETQPCDLGKCFVPEPIPCKYGDWGEWGTCDKCGGQKRRFRYITQYPQNGAPACPPKDMEQTTACPIQCGSESWAYCAWEDWGSWSDCSAQCGKGKRVRSRQVVPSTSNASMPLTRLKTAMIQEYMDLQAKADVLKKRSDSKDAALAFTGGGVAFGMALLAFRFLAVRRSSSGSASTFASQLVE